MIAMGITDFFKRLTGHNKPAVPDPILTTAGGCTPTSLISPVNGMIGLAIGTLIADAITYICWAELQGSGGTHYSLRAPKHSTFKINLYKYGTARRRKVMQFAGTQKVPLRKLGWRVIGS